MAGFRCVVEFVDFPTWFDGLSGAQYHPAPLCWARREFGRDLSSGLLKSFERLPREGVLLATAAFGFRAFGRSDLP